jgi:hypothetical protein
MLSQSSARAFTLAGMFCFLGCATLRGGKDSAVIAPVTIEIDNNLTLPTLISVYAVSDGGGIRTRIGDVPGASKRSFEFKPTSFSQPYRLIAVRQLARTIRSHVFSVGSETTTKIVWTLYPNLIGFEEFDNDSTDTAPADTTKTPVSTKP